MVNKMTSSNEGDFIREKITTNNFEIPKNEWTRVSMIFTKSGNNVNIKIKKNNNNESTLNNVPITELTKDNSNYLYIGRLLDHTSKISLRDFRIYKNTNPNTLLGKIVHGDTRDDNGNIHQDFDRIIVNELVKEKQVYLLILEIMKIQWIQKMSI